MLDMRMNSDLQSAEKSIETKKLCKKESNLVNASRRKRINLHDSFTEIIISPSENSTFAVKPIALDLNEKFILKHKENTVQYRDRLSDDVIGWTASKDEDVYIPYLSPNDYFCLPAISFTNVNYSYSFEFSSNREHFLSDTKAESYFDTNDSDTSSENSKYVSHTYMSSPEDSFGKFITRKRNQSLSLINCREKLRFLYKESFESDATASEVQLGSTSYDSTLVVDSSFCLFSKESCRSIVANVIYSDLTQSKLSQSKGNKNIMFKVETLADKMKHKHIPTVYTIFKKMKRKLTFNKKGKSLKEPYPNEMFYRVEGDINNIAKIDHAPLKYIEGPSVESKPQDLIYNVEDKLSVPKLSDSTLANSITNTNEEYCMSEDKFLNQWSPYPIFNTDGYKASRSNLYSSHLNKKQSCNQASTDVNLKFFHIYQMSHTHQEAQENSLNTALCKYQNINTRHQVPHTHFTHDSKKFEIELYKPPRYHKQNNKAQVRQPPQDFSQKAYKALKYYPQRLHDKQESTLHGKDLSMRFYQDQRLGDSTFVEKNTNVQKESGHQEAARKCNTVAEKGFHIKVPQCAAKGNEGGDDTVQDKDDDADDDNDEDDKHLKSCTEIRTESTYNYNNECGEQYIKQAARAKYIRKILKERMKQDDTVAVRLPAEPDSVDKRGVILLMRKEDLKKTAVLCKCQVDPDTDTTDCSVNDCKCADTVIVAPGRPITVPEGEIEVDAKEAEQDEEDSEDTYSGAMSEDVFEWIDKKAYHDLLTINAQHQSTGIKLHKTHQERDITLLHSFEEIVALFDKRPPDPGHNCSCQFTVIPISEDTDELEPPIYNNKFNGFKCEVRRKKFRKRVPAKKAVRSQHTNHY